MTGVARRRVVATAAAAFAVAALAAGCTQPTENDPTPDPTTAGPAPEHQFDPEDTTITYAFTDSSVDPSYHRSFVLTVVEGGGTIVVDAYGDETARDEQEVSSAVVGELLDTYNSGELAGVFDWEAPDGEGCDGGRTFALTLEDETEQAAASLYQCSGANADLVAALTDAADPLLNGFDIETLTEGRYSA